MEKIVLLVSGGLDSFIAYHYLRDDGYEIIPLFIDYNGIYSKKELKIVENLFPESILVIDGTLNFKGEETGEKAFLKNRNAYFALVASKYGKIICMAGLKDDNIGDKSPEAFIKMQDLLSEINGEYYEVFSPFWRMEKEQIIDWYISHKLPLSELLKTTSCYHPKYLFCGECPSCFRKYCAFVSNELEELIPIFLNKKMAYDYLKRSYEYSTNRQISIQKACEKLGVV